MPSPRTRTMWRNVALYALIVLPVYGLTGATIDALTGAHRGRGFWETAGLWMLAGWWMLLVFLPAALVLVALAARLPLHWSATRRRMLLVLAAPPLFALALGVAILATTRDLSVLGSAYVAIVVVPAVAYAVALAVPRDEPG